MLTVLEQAREKRLAILSDRHSAASAFLRSLSARQFFVPRRHFGSGSVQESLSHFEPDTLHHDEPERRIDSQDRNVIQRENITDHTDFTDDTDGVNRTGTLPPADDL